MSFDIGRLNRAHRIMGGGAIALLIFMFLFKWYGVSASSSIGGVSFSSSANGWHSFTNSRWIWLITIIVALGVVAMAGAARELHSPIAPGAVVAGLGALSTVLILYRIFHHPSAGVSGTVAGVSYSASAGIKIGIWLGLIAAAVITYGGYLAMQQEGSAPVAASAPPSAEAFTGLVATPAATPEAAEAPAAPEAAAAGPPIPPPAAPPGPGSPGAPPAAG